jgi:hypothetical protein
LVLLAPNGHKDAQRRLNDTDYGILILATLLLMVQALLPRSDTREASEFANTPTCTDEHNGDNKLEISSNQNIGL